MEICYMILVRWLVRTSGFEVRGKVAISCSNVLFAECNILLPFLDISYEPNSYRITISRNINSEASISYLPSLWGPLRFTEQDAVNKADAIIKHTFRLKILEYKCTVSYWFRLKNEEYDGLYSPAWPYIALFWRFACRNDQFL
jgi:hypothetical protein